MVLFNEKLNLLTEETDRGRKGPTDSRERRKSHPSRGQDSDVRKLPSFMDRHKRRLGEKVYYERKKVYLV